MALRLASRPGSPARDAAVVRTLPDGPLGPSRDAETLFSLLDGRELIVLGRRFRIDVFSVCEMGGCRYVQLSLHGAEHYMLTLRLGGMADIERIVPRLLAWLARPSISGEVLDVT
jgi:hypothetical protein